MNSTDTNELYLKTEQLLFFRIAFAGVAFVLAFGLQWFDRSDLYIWPAIRVTLAIVFYSAFALILLKRKIINGEQGLGRFNAVLIFVDVISLALLVHYTRGLESDLDVLYLLPILLSSYTFGRRGINITALLVSVSYLVLMMIENKELLPYLDPAYNSGLASAYAHHLWRRVLAKCSLLVCVAFIWARFCEYMSGLAQQDAGRLRDQLNENTILVAEVKAQAARQTLINSINSAVRSSLDLSQIFETACEELSRALKPDGCAIVCPSNYANEPPFIWQTSVKPGNEASLFGPAMCEFILEHKGAYEKNPDDGAIVKLFLFQEPAADPDFDDISEDLELAGIKSLIVKPMMYADQSKGVIIIAASGGQRDWMPFELELVNAVAGQVSVAIEHAELVEQLSRKNKDLLHKNLNLDSKNLELRAVQSQLVHQEKMASLGRLVAGIAHELNNPINFVHGNLPYLREYFEDMKKIVAAADSIPGEFRKEMDELRTKAKYDFLVTDLDNIIADLDEGAERIRHIVRNLKSFSRLDEAELKEASIHDGIESTLKILSQFYGRDKIPVDTEFGQLPAVTCFPGQLNQVWMNLLSNAAQAQEKQPEPHVWIKTELEGDKVLISIRDNGTGIKPEVQSKIFEPFYTTKPVGQGTGLGLSICHSIVERHGGQIWCESPPGEGTTFKVQIPVQARVNEFARAGADAAHDPD
ncbi:MAG TPA: ATP-binding protein [Planktothrix sp.]|jgi:signal transduction histidine kinase